MRHWIGMFIFLGSSVLALAQGNYEIQVYGSDLVQPKVTMFELHSNFTVTGTKGVLDGVLPTNHAEHETLEITHGFDEWFETGFYVFTSIQSDGSWYYVGSHIRPRFAIPQKYTGRIGLSLSNEIGWQRPIFSQDTWTWEIRPIIDTPEKLGRWYLAFNPAFDKTFHGPDANRGFVFSPNFKFSYDVTKKVAAGVEYYGVLGPATQFDPIHQQEQQIVPAVDVDFGDKWEFNFGVGVGVTGGTDHLLIKAILGYRFNFKNGSH